MTPLETALLGACSASSWDRHRSADAIGRVVRAGAAVLARYDVSGPPVRARGWSNVVWLVGDVALRIVADPHDSMQAEIDLLQRLPHGAGHPTLLAHGVQDGFGWMLTERIRAVALADAWPELDSSTRARAIAQTWQRTAAVHAADLGPPTQPATGHPADDSKVS